MKRALALAALLAGCKADLHQTTDANAPSDVSADSLATSTGDPTATAVSLTITRAGEPVPSVAVVFQSSDSTVVAAVLTNDRGVAWTEMAAGGFVTALTHEGSGSDALTTFSAVAPGDSLTLEIAPTGPRALFSFALTFPDAAAPAYAIYTPCGSESASTTTAAISFACEPVVDLVVVPLDPDGNPAGTALYAPAVSIDTPTLTLLGTYEPLAPTSFSYSNVPAAWSFIGLYHAISAERRAYEQSGGMVPSGTVASLQLAVPATTASTLTVTTEFPKTDELGRQQIYDWRAASTTYGLDVAAAQLPPYATAPAFDPGTRAVSWTERSGGGVQPDLVRAGLHVYRDDIPSGRAWSWKLVAPRSETRVTYPQLPALGFDFNPKAGDAISIDELTTMQLPGGYAAFRTHAFGDVKRAVTGASGRIVIQTRFAPEL